MTWAASDDWPASRPLCGERRLGETVVIEDLSLYQVNSISEGTNTCLRVADGINVPTMCQTGEILSVI